MSYFLGSSINAFNLLEYDYDRSLDYTFFSMGISLDGIKDKIIYKVKNANALNKLTKIHFVVCLGPYMVSSKLKSLLESETHGEAEFYKVELTTESNTAIDYPEDFYIINTLVRGKFCDMDNSIYRITNFDPQAPEYWFDYKVLLDNSLGSYNIATCTQSKKIIVSEKIMKACIDSKLTGLEFCKSIDFTHANKTECLVI